MALTYVDLERILKLEKPQDEIKEYPKIQFHEKIKKIEERIDNQDTALNSFILSPTDISQLKLFKENNDYKPYAESNILFLSERNIATGNSYIDRMLKKLGIV